MKIAILAPLVTPIAEPQRGGSQSVVSDLARGLTERGHDVDVYAATGSRMEGTNVVDTGVDSAKLADALVRPGDPDRPRAGVTREAYGRAWELIASRSYDVVHAHAFDAPAIDGGRGMACPVLHTLHLPPEPEMAETIARSATWPRPPLVAAVSRAQGLAWSQRVRVSAVLANGVPTDRIPHSVDGGDRVLFAGRLSPEKGAREAVEIAARAGVGIDVIGDAYDPEYAASLGVPIEAALPRPDLWRRMASARAVLCPMRWEEPFGLVAAEAQAAGTPVVAFRRGGLAEVVADGRTGFLVDPDDLDAAADALRRVRDIDRAACRAHAVANLDLSDALDAHEDLYEGMLFEDDARRYKETKP